jgi:3-oxoacyl-[acyl-carrier protein] reductase
MSVRDQAVIITGAARGHARSIAHAFAAEGARLALVDFAPLDHTVGELQQYDAEVVPFQLDLREPEPVKEMVDAVHQRFGRIDVLINCAGIVTHFRYAGTQRWPRIAELEPSFFENVIKTNLIGTFHTTRYTLPYMEAQGGGHIINFGQGNVGRGLGSRNREEVGATAYSVSKVAIRAFSQGVAGEEYRHGICVYAMGPGEQLFSDRSLTPEEVAERAAMVDLDLGKRFTIAAEGPLELSGRMVQVRDGQVVPVPDEVL